MMRDKNVGEAVCGICGTGGHKEYWFCSIKGMFICMNCEQICKNYSVNILPNGTHCRASYARESEKFRKINRIFIAPPSIVADSRERYKGYDREQLYNEYCDLLERHDTSNDNLHRATLRIELAAMQQELKGR